MESATSSRDPRFADPSRYPCGVVGCDNRAAGWVHADAMGVFRLDYEVRTETEFVLLCDEHLAPVRGR